MQLWDSVTGCVKCRLVSASLQSAINKIADQCNISNLTVVDDLTATFWVRRTDIRQLERTNAHVEILKRSGIYWPFIRLLKRPVIVVGIVMLVLLVFCLPTRILFIRVYGNSKITDTQILDTAQTCGVFFGAPRERVRSEIIKNTLLQSIPQLQWACVNTRGCVAEIFVQERALNEYKKSAAVSDLVAISDGIVTDITVYSGTPLCKVGQIVKKGQVLVSGYSDLGLLIKAEAANGEIMAETTRFLTAVTLAEYSNTEKCLGVHRRYSLLIGKKLIKFYKDSGISLPECGRINKIYQLTLPGGFHLPISIVEEQVYYNQSVSCHEDQTDSFDWLTTSADSFICEQMVAGKIIKKTAVTENDGEVCRIDVHYRCNEMIAISQHKEIYTDGKRN